MKRIIVVSDTSPLIALSHVALFELPKELWGKLYIPNAVKTEIQKDPGRRETEQAIKDGWLIVKNVKDVEAVNGPSQNFGLGESECFVLARELEAFLLIMDEKRGRNAAERLGLGSLATRLLSRGVGR